MQVITLSSIIVNLIYILIIVISSAKFNQKKVLDPKYIVFYICLTAYTLLVHTQITMIVKLISSLVIYGLTFFIMSKKLNLSLYYAFYVCFFGIYSEFLADAVFMIIPLPDFLKQNISFFSTFLYLLLLMMFIFLLSSSLNQLQNIKIDIRSWITFYSTPIIGIMLSYLFVHLVTSTVVDNYYQSPYIIIAVIFFGFYTIAILSNISLFIKLCNEKLRSTEHELVLEEYNLKFKQQQIKLESKHIYSKSSVEDLTLAYNMLENSEFKKAKSELTNCILNLSDNKYYIETGLSSIDGILSTCKERAKEQGVNIEFYTQFTESIYIPNRNLTYLIGSICDSSIEVSKLDSKSENNIVNISLLTAKGLFIINASVYIGFDFSSDDEGKIFTPNNQEIFNPLYIRDMVAENSGYYNLDIDKQTKIACIEVSLYNIQQASL